MITSRPSRLYLKTYLIRLTSSNRWRTRHCGRMCTQLTLYIFAAPLVRVCKSDAVRPRYPWVDRTLHDNTQCTIGFEYSNRIRNNSRTCTMRTTLPKNILYEEVVATWPCKREVCVCLHLQCPFPNKNPGDHIETRLHCPQVHVWSFHRQPREQNCFEIKNNARGFCFVRVPVIDPM